VYKVQSLVRVHIQHASSEVDVCKLTSSNTEDEVVCNVAISCNVETFETEMKGACVTHDGNLYQFKR